MIPIHDIGMEAIITQTENATTQQHFWQSKIKLHHLDVSWFYDFFSLLKYIPSLFLTSINLT